MNSPEPWTERIYRPGHAGARGGQEPEIPDGAAADPERDGAKDRGERRRDRCPQVGDDLKSD